jgi:hypothetical protein
VDEACNASDVVVAARRQLLDRGLLQEGDPYLHATARTPVARMSPATADSVGAVDGGEVVVSTDAGSITLPVVVTAMPDGVVWLPANSDGSRPRATLGAGHGDVVRPMPERWRPGLDPWQVTVEGDRIYGRGVVDNKGQHLLALDALRAVIADPEVEALFVDRPRRVIRLVIFLVAAAALSFPALSVIGYRTGFGSNPEAVVRWALDAGLRIAVIAVSAYLVIRIGSAAAGRCCCSRCCTSAGCP